ncbi:ROK family protein [Sphingomonas endolithica]|uniref:ROK family protein n=1 Tax=Sphingomonas endolithica TaxID=2972485 RepID=UPI0021AFB951|nr:ROK family protein [Sphingomonas sp. ZFBP2030]
MSAPLIAGVELGGTKCNLILARGPDDICEQVRIATTTPAETLGNIAAVLDRWTGYDALGIASFGPVSIDPAARDYGHITATTKPGWSNTDVAHRLSRPNVPTGFNSDVAGAALGEGQWGAARGLSDHAYITVGTGVGVGLVMHGEPTNGMTHPELGHVRTTRLPGDAWPGICTFHGDCVEGPASGPAIQARTGIRAPDLPLDHPVWESVAHTLAQLLHTLVLTGIPRRIVMGGGVMTGMPHLLPLIRTRLVASLGDYGATSLIEPVAEYVVPAALGNNAGPLGAVVLGQRALSAS